MLRYTVSYSNPLTRYADFALEIDHVTSDTLELQLPAWRPGRYSLQNFAKNIRKFSVWNGEGQALKFAKLTKDRWIIHTDGASLVKVQYDYWCAQMDGGGCWLDERQLYLNWICCGLQVMGREEDSYEIDLQVPDTYIVATPLTKRSGKWIAQGFDELADTPMIASPHLQSADFEQNGCRFYLWVMGDLQMDWERIIDDFRAFTQVQVELFGGDFPTDQYHYMYQILPYRHYHGVEHQHSTVIILGPDRDFYTKHYVDFLGISSHELFHTWNVTRLRAKEMVPYDYTGENYFETGFVEEGTTTYYGDLMLARSAVFGREEYFAEVNQYFQRHFDNFGRFHTSLADTSIDLWLDGYSPRAPGRGVSIYIKGALIAMILDLRIRRESANRRSLDDVMRIMWERYGQNEVGFLIGDYQAVAEEVAGVELDGYFEQLVYGTTALESHLSASLAYVGCQMISRANPLPHEAKYGVRFASQYDNHTVAVISPCSPAEEGLSTGDIITSVNGTMLTKANAEALFEADDLVLTLIRQGRKTQVSLQSTDHRFFAHYMIAPVDSPTQAQKEAFWLWCGHDLLDKS